MLLNEAFILVEPEMLAKVEYGFCSVVNVEGIGKAVLFTGKEGKKVKVDPSLVDEHYVEQGRAKNPLEFDYYIVFDSEFTANIEATRRFVEDTEAWDIVGVPEKFKGRINISEHSYDLDNALLAQSVLANTPGVYESEEMQLEYAGHAAEACELVAAGIADKKFEHVIGVLRAGDFAKQSMESLLDKGFQYHPIEAKRVPLRSKKLTVGYIDNQNILSSGILEGTRTLVTELCAASGVTMLGLEVINKAKGTTPKETMLVAPVVSQRGAELLMESFPHVTVQSGPELVRLMNERYYLLHHAGSESEQKVCNELAQAGLPIPGQVQVLGDGGDLTNIARIAANNS